MEANVPPNDFACAMRKHWTANLGNVVSPALLDLWRVMAATFNEAIDASAGSHERRALWRVLQPPTGSGKTQGTRVYCAVTAMKNREREPRDKVGSLIVSREIAEADKLAEEINLTTAGLLGLPPSEAPRVALARHSENAKTVTVEEMRSADVLIITHAAYVRALDMLKHSDGERWETLSTWEHGPRRLTVVDETITNIVESYQLDLETLKKVVAMIPEDVRETFPQQMEALDKMLEVLRMIRQRASAATSPSDAVLWNREQNFPGAAPEAVFSGCDMSSLRSALAGVDGQIEQRVAGAEGLTERRSIAPMIDHTLKSVEAAYSRFAWYARRGADDTLNASRLLLPADFPAPVVLDATASQDVLWSLLGDRVTRPIIPPRVRNYGNVTLHVARVSGGIGKTAMAANGRERIARVVAHFNERFIGQRRKVLMVLHKAVEHLAVGHEITFGDLRVAHWGAIDGKNEWGDCDTAVIVGLSYRERIWANNLLMALKGVQTTEWLRTNGELRQDMERRQLTVSLVQAINRIHCRRVTDERGNCPPSEVFACLPSGVEGDVLLKGIVGEMPGIQVREWDFNLDGPAVKVRRGSSHEALIRLMTGLPPGEVTLKRIASEFNLTQNGAKTLAATLRDAASPLSKRLAEIGVSWVSTGVGRGARSFLLKRAV